LGPGLRRATNKSAAIGIGRGGRRGLATVLFVEQCAASSVWRREKGDDDGCDGIKYGHRHQFSPLMPSHRNR
jgi:hypothetical protein